MTECMSECTGVDHVTGSMSEYTPSQQSDFVKSEWEIEWSGVSRLASRIGSSQHCGLS